jgi:hypothetical protein
MVRCLSFDGGFFVFSEINRNEEVITMKVEILWGTITLIGIVLSFKYRTSSKQFIGPMVIGFTGALWVAYVFG